MFWKRKEKIVNLNLGLEPLVIPPPPPRKEFKTMLEILRDAEKFDNAGEKEVCDNTLKTLIDYVSEFRSKNIT